MRTDDERLEKARNEMVERIAKFNALMLEVMKGHLVVEQAMDAFLSAALFKHEYVRDGRFNFSQKAQMCRALSSCEDTDDLWEVIWGINSVRNQVADDLDVDEIRKKMDKLRKTFFDTLTPKQVAGLKEQSDDYIAQSACVISAGFLATLKDDAEKRRKIIDENWKPEA